MSNITSEINVRELFFKHAEEIGFKIVKSQTAFPDYVIQGKSGSLYNAEVEYKLSNFIKHKHDWRKVHFIIFWIDDLNTIAPSYIKEFGEPLLPLLNLKKELEKLGFDYN